MNVTEQYYLFLLLNYSKCILALNCEPGAEG